jgi:dTDP-4-amino-4,6-dideoxygalactose transaminase
LTLRPALSYSPPTMPAKARGGRRRAADRSGWSGRRDRDDKKIRRPRTPSRRHRTERRPGEPANMRDQTAAPRSATATGDADLLPSVPLLALDRQYAGLRDEIRAALERVCDSGRFVLGPEVNELEAALARTLDVPHAITCASGSDALLVALMALDVGAGDEVILPSYTFFATASAVTRLGAVPIFADIDPTTYLVDPADVARKLSRRTKAIVPVHLFGRTADMDALAPVAKAAGVPIVEDAAQSILSTWHGRCTGGLGDVGCFSFYPTKNLGGAGDGGFLTTTRDDLAARLRLLRVHGMEPRYYHQVVGINSRLDTLQAAVLLVKLPHLEAWTAARQANAARYGSLFADYDFGGRLTLPTDEPRGRHVWNQYVIRVADGRRDALRAHLASHGVGTEIYYPVPLHLQQCFAHLGWRTGDLPQTEQAAAETLALPIFPELTAAEQRTVVARIAEFLEARPTGAAKPARESGIKPPHSLRRFIGRADDVRC